jgi:glycosyltransferase involved in cell wall biosynthesis
MPRGRVPATPRVLILVQNLPVPFDRRVWQEATSLVAAGYRVHIICPRTKAYPRRRELVDGIHIYRYWPGPEADSGVGAYLVEYSIAVLSQALLALGVRIRHRVDIVHICNPPDLLFLCALPLLALGGRLIYDHHDACPELMVAKGRPDGSRLVRLMKRLERLTYRFATVSIETNGSFRAIATGRGGMRAEDVFVVRSAPAARRFADAEPDEQWRRGRKHLVGYVGIMGSQDGLDYLLDAAAELVRRGRDDVQFVLVGDGTELPRLRSRAADLGLGRQVEFTGLVSSDKLLGSILATADVCVSPDEANAMNDISTMNKIMEYMSLGKPVVQFDLTEGRVSAADASLYAARNDPADLADCILRLVDDEALRTRMGEIGRQRMRTHLSWEAQVPQLLAAYDRALGRPVRVVSDLRDVGMHDAVPRQNVPVTETAVSKRGQ